jgi:hypothetical protein
MFGLSYELFKQTKITVGVGTLVMGMKYLGVVDGHCCRNPTLAKCGGETQHFQSWGFGILQDSRMFRA